MRTEKLTVLALGLFGVTSLAACGEDKSGAPAPGSEASAGSVDLALQLPDGDIINSASYTITGPNGFAKTGTINLSQSNTLTAVIGGLPVGTGYSITISATSTSGA